ncbi:MAG: sugar phosphate nucleotidyltransferase [Pseudomonadota bacterium]
MDFSSNLITPVVFCGGMDLHHESDESAERPKPFQSRSGNLSLFQQTLLRVMDPGRFNPPMIVADEAHKSLVEFQMEMIGAERSALLLEPQGCGTAASLALAALISGAFGADGALLALPSDQRVRDPNAWLGAVEHAVTGAHSGALLAFGRKAGPGDEAQAWVQRGAHLFDEAGGGVVDAEVYRMDKFLPADDEKDLETLSAEGDCYCNSGMYLFPVKSVLEDLLQHAPAVLTACQQALVEGSTEGDILTPSEEKLSQCPVLSIEAALFERTRRGALVPTGPLWTEETGKHMPQANAEPEAPTLSPSDKVVLRDVSNSEVQTRGPLTVVAGLDDVVVVNTGESVVVAARSHVSALLDAAGNDGGPLLPESALQMLCEAVRTEDEVEVAETLEELVSETPVIEPEADAEPSFEPETNPGSLEGALDELFKGGEEDEDDQDTELLLHAGLVSAA